MSVIKDCLTGLAIGDAMGVPIEEYDRKRLINKPVTNMLGWGNYYVPEGSWSDDTSMTLATIDAILESDGVDITHIADKLCEWVNDAKYTPTGELFSITDTTRFSLMRYWDSKNASTCGGIKPTTNDNGSIIRMAPIALYCFYKNLPDKKIYDLVYKVSAITNANVISIIGCFIYVKFMIYILNGKTIEEAYKLIRKYKYDKFFDLDLLEEYERVIKNDISELPMDEIESDNYVVHALEATIWVLLHTNSFESAIIGAINLGECTDNIGSLTGAIAGIVYKNKSIPKTWAESLQRKDFIDKLARKHNTYLTK